MALIKCGECGREVSDKASTCPGCGAPISSPQSAEASGKNAANGGKGILNQNIGCGGAVAIGLVFLLLVGMCSEKDKTSPSSAAVSSQSVSVGGDGRVVVDSGVVLVAVDDAAYDRLMELAVASDYLGMAEMVAAGRLLEVPSGTRVKVIGSGFEKREVRIVEGPHLGHSGWVTSTLVKP